MQAGWSLHQAVSRGTAKDGDCSVINRENYCENLRAAADWLLKCLSLPPSYCRTTPTVVLVTDTKIRETQMSETEIFSDATTP